MRPWILPCLITGLVADTVAFGLWLAGLGPTTVAIAVGLGAASTAGAAASLRAGVSTGAPTPLDPAAPPPVVVADPDPVAYGSGRPAGEPLDNRPWLSLAEEAVALVDELERHRADFDETRAEVADHVVSRLCEILERCGVEAIDGGSGAFDRTCHQPDGPVRPAPGARVIATLSPGFRVGPRVLRKARVRVESPGMPGPGDASSK